ncbi:19464_t:CDS:2 [Rhizophagus irregularis]|nr:19464_t:CDS:2 [Rhizophagus irregularis]
MNNCDELLGDCYSDGKTDYSRDDDGCMFLRSVLSDAVDFSGLVR